MRKFQAFFNDIVLIRYHLRGYKTKLVKSSLGDSTLNNRTLTVSQTIRYLEINAEYVLATYLSNTSSFLEKDILKARNRRTDAIDINEFVNTYRKQVIEKQKYRREIGRLLR